MDKAHLHHIWTRFRQIKPWYFLLAAVVSLVVGVMSLRQNNLTMVQLRNDLYAADKNDANVAQALQKLQIYVTSHMNTNLAIPNGPYPPIQLEYTYQRLALAATQAASDTNQTLYTEAQAYCQKQNPNDFSGRNRVPCIEQYVQDHGIKVQPIPAALYKFNFLSPAWSPDLAGLSLLAAALFFLTFIVVWLTDRWFKSQIR